MSDLKTKIKVQKIFGHIFIFGFVLSVMLPHLVHAQNDDLKLEIDKIIKFDTDLSFKKIPGFIIGIIDVDKTYTYSYGSSEPQTSKQLDDLDIFELGSCTKVITSFLFLKLFEQNICQPSDPVNKYIPQEYQNHRLNHLTIQDLLDHQSNIPLRPKTLAKKDRLLNNPYAFFSKHDLLMYYKNYLPTDNKNNYSHTNYALLEIIAEQASNQEFEQIMQKLVLDPIGMTQTFVDFPEDKQVHTQGYSRGNSKVDPWDFSSFSASEGIKSNLIDLMKFTNHVMNYPKFSTQITQKDGLTHRHYIHEGWHYFIKNKLEILTHFGKTAGHSAFIGMIPSMNKAVVILGNSSYGTEDLGILILRLISYNWNTYH